MEYRSTYRGEVKGLHEDYEDKNLVRLDIEPVGPRPKVKKGIAMPVSSRSETVSKELGQHCAVGDRVEVVTVIRKVRAVKRKGGNPGNPGGKDEKGY